MVPGTYQNGTMVPLLVRTILVPWYHWYHGTNGTNGTTRVPWYSTLPWYHGISGPLSQKRLEIPCTIVPMVRTYVHVYVHVYVLYMCTYTYDGTFVRTVYHGTRVPMVRTDVHVRTYNVMSQRTYVAAYHGSCLRVDRACVMPCIRSASLLTALCHSQYTLGSQCTVFSFQSERCDILACTYTCTYTMYSRVPGSVILRTRVSTYPCTERVVHHVPTTSTHARTRVDTGHLAERR
jgi:hypothetical protein